MGSRPGRLATGRRADRFLQKGSLRSCRLSLQPGRAVAEIWLRGLIRRARRLHQAGLQRHRLAAASLTASNKCGWEDIMAKFDLNDDGGVVIVGFRAGGGTLGNELAQKGVKVVILEAGPRIQLQDFVNHERKPFPHLTFTNIPTTSPTLLIPRALPHPP